MAKPIEQLIEAELAHYAQLRKNREAHLAELRKEFPDVSAEQVLKRYVDRRKALSGDTGSPKHNKGPSVI